MKTLIYTAAVAGLLWGCQDREAAQPSDLTGNESSYALMAGSDYPVSGTVTFKEKKDGTTQISIALTGTDGNIQMPVHLHMGNTATDAAEVAAFLTPVASTTGVSETLLSKLGDETPITYTQLMAMDACIKIHLGEAGPDKNTIIAAGDIGKAAESATSGRLGISVCKSE